MLNRENEPESEYDRWLTDREQPEPTYEDSPLYGDYQNERCRDLEEE